MLPKNTTRRNFLKAAGISIASLSLGGCFASQAESNRQHKPNIIFMFTDDHAIQAISAYNSRLARVAPTPNLDRIGNEGMILDRCYCTNSICSPSRAVILTGKHSHLNSIKTNEINNYPFDGSQQTFPKILKEYGYTTAIVGKWHLGSEPTGFDYWNVFPGQGYYYNPIFRTPEGEVTVQGYATEITTNKALDWLENGRDKSKPFMLMLQHKAPHRPWQPALDKLTRFDDVEIPEPDSLFDDYSGRGTPAREQTMSISESMKSGCDLKLWDNKETIKKEQREYKKTVGRMTPAQLKVWNDAYNPKNEAFRKANLSGKDLVRWKYQRYLKDYLRCISSVDDSMGQVLDYLDKNDLADNTVVIYSSDQGFYLGEHGWFDKRFMYEESFRMPFLIRWPGVIKPGTRNCDLIQNLDFAETFLDIVGADIPADMQGVSLVPLFKGKRPSDWRDSLYYHYYEFGAHNVYPHEGVSTKRYKLMHFYTLDEWEFYDLKSDPNEMKSQYDNPKYQSQIQQLKTELKRLKKEYKVPEHTK